MQSLPQTGSSEKVLYSILGLGLLAAGLGLSISAGKSKEE
ncbi:LPXTG cell wall anchor domain-containing protein [Streptococcus sp. DD11]|nr:LPXTG cell wall anchor domain-containing protein [Streptococcus sp. DD11]